MKMLTLISIGKRTECLLSEDGLCGVIMCVRIDDDVTAQPSRKSPSKLFPPRRHYWREDMRKRTWRLEAATGRKLRDFYAGGGPKKHLSGADSVEILTLESLIAKAKQGQL